MIVNIQAIVLAGGMAKRFNTDKTKLVETLCGKELILYPLSLLDALNIPTSLVVGFQADSIKKIVEQAYPKKFSYIEQLVQEGTAHAVHLSAPLWNQKHILIMKADIPLLKTELIETVYKKHIESDAVLTFTYAHCNNPSGFSYDKVIKRNNKLVIKSAVEVETDDHCCIDGGLYMTSQDFLKQGISQIKRKKQTNEYHISDLVEIAHRMKKIVTAISVPFDQLRAIGTLQELWAAEQIKRSKLIKKWMKRGVRFSAAQTVHIDIDVTIGSGSVIGAGVHLTNGTTVGKNCMIGPFSLLHNAQLGNQVRIEAHSIMQDTKIGDECTVGPFAHLQKETVLGNKVEIGNFVEIKRSTIADKTKAKHLTYVGDAIIGTQVNIGAGTITCNYDGKEKHTTTIHDQAFIGTNNSLVAPVTIGKGAFTAAGSVITKDVPPDALSIARAQQVNKEGYAKKLREGEIEENSTPTASHKSSFLFMGAVKSRTTPTTK